MNFTQQHLNLQSKAINWIFSNRNQFLSLEKAEDFNDHIKRMGELVLLCQLYKTIMPRTLNLQIDKLLYLGIKKLNEPDYVEQIIRSSNRFVSSLIPFATICCSLYKCKYEIKPLSDILSKLVETRYPILRDLPPSRLMDLCYSLDTMSISNSFPKVASLFKKTLLAKNPPILYLSQLDVYAITHIIFYLSNFGLRKIEETTTSQMHYICWLIDALMGLFLYQKNWDIVAELLMCHQCLNFYSEPLCSIAWNNLMRTQKEDGSLTGATSTGLTINDEIKGSNNYEFKENYHTTIVTLAASLLYCKAPNDHVNINNNNNHNWNSRLSNNHGQHALQQSYQWLQVIRKDMSDSASFLYHLLGEWIYGNVIDQQICNSGRLQETASNIKLRLDEQLKNNFSSTNLDPALVLLCAGIFRRLKLTCKVLESFVDEIANALKLHNSKSTVEEDISLFLSRLLTYKLGYIPMPRLPLVSSLKELTSRSYSDKHALHDIMLYASARTCYGKNQVRNKDFQMHTYAALSSSMLSSMYSYNLDLALRLLRTMRYLSLHRTRSFTQAFNFLLNQQSQNGRFGFFASEVAQIYNDNPKYNSQEAIYLPVTVSAMWTIAETIDRRFILLHSV
jgi:hypothetical protein